MIKVDKISKIYQGDTPTYALDEVSLTLPNKGMVFIVGKSGSGKSTLLNILAGFDKPTKGKVYFSNHRLDKFSPVEYDHYRNKIIGFVFQDFCLIENFTAYQNIKMCIDYQNEKISNDDINKVLKAVDMEGYGRRLPRQLSAGQKQRIAIARALAKNPKVILADEPTGNLDSKTTKQILELLKEISKERLVVIVSHNKEDALKYSDRIIELSDGKVIVNKYKNEEYINEYQSEEENIILPNKGRLTSEQIDDINYRINRFKGKVNISKCKDEFLPITKDDEESDNINILKTKMGLKNLLKYSWMFFKNQLFAFLLIVIIVSALITTLSISLQFSNYDGQLQYQEALDKSNTDVIFFKQDHPDSHGENETFDYMYDLDYDAKENLEKEFPNQKTYDIMSLYLPINYYYSVDYSWNDTKSSNFSPKILPRLNNLVVCDEDYLKTLFGNYEVIGDINAEDGIIITDYTANSIIRAFARFKAKTYEEVINNSYCFKTYGIKISCIIKTDYTQKLSDIVGENIDSSVIEKEEFADFCDELLYKYGVAYTLNPNYYEIYKKEAIANLDSYNVRKHSFKANDVTYELNNSSVYFYNAKEGHENEMHLTIDIYNNIFNTHCTTNDQSEFKPETITYTVYDVDGQAFYTQEYLVTKLTTSSGIYIPATTREILFSRNAHPIGFSVLDNEDISEIVAFSGSLNFDVTNSRIIVVENAVSVIIVFKDLFDLLTRILIISIIVLVIVNAINTINKNIYNIGVSRAMGAHMSEMAFIFSIQMVVFGVLVIGLSLVLDLYSINVLNSVIQNNIAKILDLPGIANMNYLIYNPAIVSTCTGLVVVLTIVSLFFPILTIRLMNPVNIIKARH